MRGEPADEAARWLEQSRRDLDDAEFARDGERYNLACFLSQQAAEKALKAFIYSQGAEAVWGHSVAELCSDAARFDPVFLELKRTAGSLDAYYIPTRYPNGLPGGIPAEAFIKENAESAIGLARSVIETVATRMRLG